MALFEDMTITRAGKSLMVSLLTNGGKLTFQGLALGDGELALENPEELTALKHEVKRVPVDKHERAGDTVVLTGTVSSDTLEAPLYHRELGIIAEGVDGEAILLAYGNAGDRYDYIPATGESAHVTKRIETALGFAELATIFRDANRDDWMTVEGFYTRIDQILPGLLEEFYDRNGFADAVAEAKSAAVVSEGHADRAKDEADRAERAAESIGELGEFEQVIGEHNQDALAHGELLSLKADKDEIPDVSGLATKGELSSGLSAKLDIATAESTYATITQVSRLAPVGTIAFILSDKVPTGWLKCNGAALSSTVYPSLYFAVIGFVETYNEGNVLMFRVPDLRGCFVRGWDDGAAVDTGRVLGSLQTDAIRNITGGLGWIGSSINAGQASTTSAIYWSNTGSYGARNDIAGTSRQDLTFDASRNVPTARDNRPRNIALMPIIKY